MEPPTFATAAKFLVPAAIAGIKKAQSWALNTYGVRKILVDFNWNVDHSKFHKIYVDAVVAFNQQLLEDPAFFGGEANSILRLLKENETEKLFRHGFFEDISEQQMVEEVCAFAFSRQENYGHILHLIPALLDTLKIYIVQSLFNHMDPEPYLYGSAGPDGYRPNT